MVAKPVAGMSVGVARSVLPRLVGERLSSEFAEKGMAVFGDALAKGLKSGTNSVTRKALSSATAKPYMQSMFLTAALATAAIEAQAQQYDMPREEVGFPAHNTSLRYI